MGNLTPTIPGARPGTPLGPVPGMAGRPLLVNPAMMKGGGGWGPAPVIPGMNPLLVGRPGCPAGMAPGPMLLGKGAAMPQVDKKRAWSPHAGSRAIRQAAAGDGPQQPPKSRASSSSSSHSRSAKSSSSRSSRGKKRKKKKKKKAKSKRSRSSSSSCSSSSSGSRNKRCKRSQSREQAGGASTDTKEMEDAKKDALEKLMSMNQVEPNEERMKQWRALLRQWHPDKNPEKVEVATELFQFLQKGKRLLKAD